MGQSPEEKVTLQQPSFTGICFNFLGPFIVKGALNKGVYMKVWLLLFFCQATEAIYFNILHSILKVASEPGVGSACNAKIF